MPKRDWGSKCSVAGWVAFFALLAFLWAEGVAIFPKTEAEPDYCKATTEKQDAKNSAIPRPRIENDAPTEPKQQGGRNSAECVQWRSTVAAEIQARYTRFGFWLLTLTLGFTAWAAVSARNAAISTRDAAHAAGRSADVAHETLVATQRAWIERINISVFGDFRPFKNGPIQVAIAFEFKNIGNAPALHVQTRAWLLPGLNSRIPWQEAEKHFEAVKSKPVESGFIVYPGRIFSHRDDPSRGVPCGAISHEQIEAACDKGRDRQIMLYVAACIDYTFPSDAKNHHQANFLMVLERTDGMAISANVDVIREDHLRLRDAFADYYPAD